MWSMRLICWEPIFVSSAIAISFGVDMRQASAQTVSPSDLIPTAPPLIPVNPASPNLLLPPSEELLKPSNPKPSELYPQLNPPSSTDTLTDTFIVREFQIVGSTVFSTEELAATVKSFTDRPLTFTDLLQVRSAIADLYIRNGYITSGAFIPPQEANNGEVTIQVIEGNLVDIQITGMNRLDPNYVKSRLSLATVAPLNRDRLINALQLLQVDPLFSFVSAELKTGSELGTNILAVRVAEANSFNAQIGINNSAPVSVGQLQRQIEISDRNLLGFGDSLSCIFPAHKTRGKTLHIFITQQM
jgi:hemolysin activation/secretion protein